MYKCIDEIGKKIIVILGPTASGKSELSVKLAKKFNGEIISADSRQVYKGLNLSSGKVKGKWKKNLYVYKNIPHHCLDYVSLKKIYTIAEYKKCAEKAVKNIHSKKRVPFLVGGSAFYIYGLIYDWKIPEIKPDWKLRKKLEKKSADELFKILKKLDPERAKNIDAKNPRRLMRAIEVIKSSKKPVPKLKTSSPYDLLLLGVKTDPEALKKKIQKRLKQRLNQGMIKEIKNLRQKNKISWKRLYDLGLETRWVSLFLRKKISKKEMIENLNKEIWRYSKRQMTWFKKDKNIRWISSEKEAEKLVKEFI